MVRMQFKVWCLRTEGRKEGRKERRKEGRKEGRQDPCRALYGLFSRIAKLYSLPRSLLSTENQAESPSSKLSMP